MARKVQFDKEFILQRSSAFIREYGLQNLNARNLCKYIGCSTQPLFKNFKNMEVLKKEIRKYVHDYYDEFILKIVDKEDYLYTISYAYCLFAKKEPENFKLLFMSELAGTRTIDEVLKSPWNVETIASIPKQYHITQKEAEALYRDTRFYTHGLSCQIAVHSIAVTEKEIKELIRSIIQKVRR